MDEKEIKLLCVITGFKKARKNEFIFFDDVKRIYFLKKGIIKIIQTDEKGNESVKAFLQQGDVFGDITLNQAVAGVAIGDDGNKRGEYAKVVSEEAIICSFLPQDFESVLEKNPSIALRFTKKVGEELLTLQIRYNDLVFKDVKTRLMNFLLDFSKKNGKKEENTLTVKNFLTHQDIADIIGATRQTVTSLLNEFERENKLLYSRSKITIPDVAKFY